MSYFEEKNTDAFIQCTYKLSRNNGIEIVGA